MRLFAKFTQFLFDGDELAPGAATPPAPEPVAAAPAPVPTPPAGDTPWASDLAALGLDETGRSAVDQYLRTTVQPRTTKLETELAQAAPARELFTDFQDDPLGTFMAVGESLFENADPAALRAALGLPPEDAEPAAPVAEPAAAPLDPRLAKLIEREEVAEREAAWNESMAPIREADPTIKDHLFAPFVVSADGDFEAAHAAYNAHLAELRALHGLAPDTPIVPAPPSVLGAGEGGGAAPPIQPKYASLDDALDATMDDVRAARAPAVI